jgi:hypothetical protein
MEGMEGDRNWTLGSCPPGGLQFAYGHRTPRTAAAAIAADRQRGGGVRLGDGADGRRRRDGRDVVHLGVEETLVKIGVGKIRSEESTGASNDEDYNCPDTC